MAATAQDSYTESVLTGCSILVKSERAPFSQSSCTDFILRGWSLSKSRKSSRLSLSESTRGGIFRARGFEGLKTVSGTSFISCYNSSLRNTNISRNDTSI